MRSGRVASRFENGRVHGDIESAHRTMSGQEDGEKYRATEEVGEHEANGTDVASNELSKRASMEKTSPEEVAAPAGEEVAAASEEAQKNEEKEKIECPPHVTFIDVPTNSERFLNSLSLSADAGGQRSLGVDQSVNFGVMAASMAPATHERNIGVASLNFDAEGLF